MTSERMIEMYKKGLPIKNIIDEHKESILTKRNNQWGCQRERITAKEATKIATTEVYGILRRWYKENISPKE